MRYRRVLPAGRRPQAGGRHDRPDRAPRPGRGRAVGPRGRPGRGPARSPPALDHRPQHRCRPAADQGRADPGLQRRAVQLPDAAGRADRPRHHGSSPGPTPRWCWRRGGPGAPTRCPGSAACSPSRCRPAVRRAGAGPGPARHQAAVLPAARPGGGVRLRAQGVHGRDRLRAAGRAGGPGGLDALLLAARAALRHRRGAQAPGRVVGPVHPGRPPYRAAVLADGRRGRRGRGGPRRPTWGR